MKKVNIREALLDMDKQTYCQYDLYTLYEACNLQECDKKEIAKMISDDKSPEDIYDKLVDKFSDSVTTTDDDDISDMKESFGDDLIDSQYLDDTSDGHWSWDYDDDELANIYGGDTKYDNHPDGIEESQSLAEYWYFTKHGVQPGSIPNNIDVLEIKDTPDGTYFKGNRVLTTKELQDYEIKEKSPEMKESITPEYKMVEYTYDGDNVSDYLGHVRVRTNSDKIALHAAEKYVLNKQSEYNPRNFKICDDNYTNVDVIDSDGDYLTTLESVDESKQIGLSLSEKLERIDDLFEQSLKHIGFGYEEVYSLDYATANKLIDQFITYLDAENIDLSYKSEITPLGVKVGGNSTGIAHNYVYNLVKSEWRLMSQAETQQLLSDMSDTRKLDQYLNENLYHYYEQDRYGFCKRIDRSRFLNLANKQSGSRFIGQGSQMSMLDTKVKIYEHNGPGYNFKINVSTLTYDSLQRENKFGIKKNTSDEEVDKFLNESVESKSINESKAMKEESSNNGWVKRWNFLDNYYKGDLVISKISSPVDAWHVEKVAPNGRTIKHLGNYKSLEVAMDAAEKHLKDL